MPFLPFLTADPLCRRQRIPCFGSERKLMVFSSLLFLFVFLSISMAVYLLVPARNRNMVLLISSLIFYAWGGPRYLLLLLGETLISYLCAIGIEKSHRQSQSKMWIWIECVSLLGLLAIFKYLPLIGQTLQTLTGWPAFIPGIVLPIGISFYTFQLLSYVIDVYRKEVRAQYSYWKLLLYSSLFHQCIAGPIVRYKTVADEIDNHSVTINDVYAGIRRFSIGLAKKAVLANGMGALADQLAPIDGGALASASALSVWAGLFCYMLQIYLDFSAYSDMAVGMGRMVGFHYLENFNYPYQAKSVQDFWRRWHISLSTFFRDYVYIPLGGSRGTTLVYVRNMITVWFLTGLWHGASWNYVLWGLYYLCFLLLERFVIRQRIPSGWNRLYTLSVVFFGWILFRYEDLGVLTTAFAGMFGFTQGGWFSWSAWSEILSNCFLIAAGVIACTDLGVKLEKVLSITANKNSVCFALYCLDQLLLPVLLLLISVLALIGNVYNPFLYFQF